MNLALVRRRRWLILAVLCVSEFMVVVDNTIVNVALPTLSRDLGATTSQLQWIVDSYSLVFAGLLLAGGSLGDRFGRKGALQLGLALFAVTSVLATLAGSPGQLIAARAAMGIGGALIFPATLAILTNVFHDAAGRAKAIGIWAGISGLAVALGPVAGGWLLEHFWWGSIFLVNVPIVIVALVAGQILLPASRDPRAGRFDLPGLGLSVVTVTTLVYTVIEGPHHGWTSPMTLGGFALAALLLGVFIAWERHRVDPMLDVRIFRNARFSAAAAAISIAFFALFGFIFLITQYFQFVRGYSTLSAGLHTLPFAVAAGAVAVLSPWLAQRLGSTRVVAAGLAFMAAGFVVAATLSASSGYWGPVIASMVLIAAGLSLTTAPATEAIMGALPRAKAGVGSAVNDTTRELGGTLGVAVVGSAFSSVYGPQLIDGLHGVAVPAPALTAAEGSVAAATDLADQAPAATQPVITEALQTAFMSGLTAGSLIAAIAAALGAIAVLRFLPARGAQPAPPPTGHEPPDNQPAPPPPPVGVGGRPQSPAPGTTTMN
ncbi:MFS transporter [Actinomadura sp. 1N219]|uniref:MFS transporter n=1 Tax=Actinomadura sp. 1N219 TaxID=3375152 RepID=UPI0037BA40A6